MMPDYDELRQLIERRYRRYLLFVLHVVAFMATVAVTGWWILNRDIYPGDWKNLIYLAGWGAIFFMHWLYYNMANRRDREIEMAWKRYSQKRGFDTAGDQADIFDDGELIDWIDEADPVVEKAKRGVLR